MEKIVCDGTFTCICNECMPVVVLVQAQSEPEDYCLQGQTPPDQLVSYRTPEGHDWRTCMCDACNTYAPF